MARLRLQPSPGAEEDRDDLDFMRPCAGQRRSRTAAVTESLQPACRTSPRKNAMKSYRIDDRDSEAEDLQSSIILQPKTMPQKNGSSKQIRLGPIRSPLISMSSRPTLRPKGLPPGKPDIPGKPKAMSMQNVSEKLSQSDVEEYSDSVPEVDADRSTWCGSGSSSDESEDELPSPRKFLAIHRKTGQQALSGLPTSFGSVNDSADRFRKLSLSGSDIDPVPGKKPTKLSEKTTDASSRPVSSSDKENHGAFLRFSPPRLHRPPQGLTNERLITPPQSPSKSRLQSPTKTKPRIPTPPHRPSLDEFWDAKEVNDWNEQHSPRKILKSPRKLKFLQDESQQSPTSSPRKLQSPYKRTKAQLEAKKTFETTKHRIAEDLLAELDAVITNGRVGELAASTGGVRFIWSKTLNSTAGRANWRRETIKTRHADGTSTTTHKHHASIELAEKVIDDEERLVNVIAHEFCHLANFMVSGIKDQPHGRQFKEWGRKCTAAFGHRGVKVTTKHTFEIEYKYIWQCSNEECGVEFKRHSKSIDLKRHTCGSCRSKLVQIKPVPRKTGESGGSGTGYAAYVKENFASVKQIMPGASQKEVMQAVAVKYRREKLLAESSRADESMGKQATNDSEESTEVDTVTKALEVITIDDD